MAEIGNRQEAFGNLFVCVEKVGGFSVYVPASDQPPPLDPVEEFVWRRALKRTEPKSDHWLDILKDTPDEEEKVKEVPFIDKNRP